jgi:hypothetical protein
MVAPINKDFKTVVDTKSSSQPTTDVSNDDRSVIDPLAAAAGGALAAGAAGIGIVPAIVTGLASALAYTVIHNSTRHKRPQ